MAARPATTAFRTASSFGRIWASLRPRPCSHVSVRFSPQARKSAAKCASAGPEVGLVSATFPFHLGSVRAERRDGAAWPCSAWVATSSTCARPPTATQAPVGSRKRPGTSDAVWGIGASSPRFAASTAAYGSACQKTSAVGEEAGDRSAWGPPARATICRAVSMKGPGRSVASVACAALFDPVGLQAASAAVRRTAALRNMRADCAPSAACQNFRWRAAPSP